MMSCCVASSLSSPTPSTSPSLAPIVLVDVSTDSHVRGSRRQFAQSLQAKVRG